MTTLTDIEQLVLESMDEDLSDPEVWDGDGELRDALGDAIDELAVECLHYATTVYIPLQENVMLYSVNVNRGVPLFIRRARLLGVDRDLTATTLRGLQECRGDRWMLSRGTPYEYVELCTDTVLFFPVPSGSGDAVELELLYCPDHYSIANEFLSIREELEQALFHYGRYYLLMRSGESEDHALRHFEVYSRMLKDGKMYRAAMYKARAYEQRGTLDGYK